ncbi:DUF3396 domain-containing protein [Serratia rubidaea]|uniref:type VI immunity family protein n=1 Tax=Serratia rubidaea TaxID=61652 RepID=UPI002DBFF3BF|nr:type VI immunity family protein [Serratia rubidaea]MEB7585487.1 DUF3396 domain-containing protein [Serratia rubidaea]
MKADIESLQELFPNNHNLALLDNVAITGKNAIEARVALGIELFIRPREQQQLYPQMNQLAEDYYQRFSAQLNSYSLTGSGRNSLMRKDFLKKLHNKLANQNYDASYNTHLFYDDTGQANIFNASPWQARFSAQPQEKGELSSVEASLAVCDEQENPHFDTLLAMTLQWCQTIKPTFGTAGLCLSYSGMPRAKYTYALLQRHPGIEHMDDLGFILETRYVDAQGEHFITDRIKGVNWLTILCDALLEELGGLERCKKMLEPECHVQPYDGGVVIVAGPVPQLGDAYQQIIPERYRKVSSFTKPIRFEDYDGDLIRVDPPLDSHEETLKWIRRFD